MQLSFVCVGFCGFYFFLECEFIWIWPNFMCAVDFYEFDILIVWSVDKI